MSNFIMTAIMNCIQENKFFFMKSISVKKIPFNHLITYKQFDKLYRLAPQKANLREIKILLEGLPINKCKALIQQSKLNEKELERARVLYLKQILNRTIKKKIWENSTVQTDSELISMLPSNEDLQEFISNCNSNIHEPPYYNMLMRYYVKTGQHDKASCIYRNSPNVNIQETNLWYLLQTNQMDKSLELFDEIKKFKSKKTYGMMITKYSELGLYNDVQNLVDEMKHLDIVPYKSTLVNSIPAIEPEKGYKQIMKLYSVWLKQNKYRVCATNEPPEAFNGLVPVSAQQVQLLFSIHPFSPLDIKRAMIYFHSTQYQVEICEELYGMTTDRICTLLMVEMYHILGIKDKKDALYSMINPSC
ncbi:hypothetical protein HDV06_005736 [Boothiomyces sp. JEL0866]|nr:hypothetical protein HDV06_005736 [Boothiomyces sp. JEL0866]